MKMQIVFILALFACTLQSISAQTYNTAIGIRLDDGMNLTGRQSIGGRDMLEAMIHMPILTKDFGTTLLYERHKKLMSSNFSVYYGVGPHLYLRNQGKQSQTEVNNNIFGVSGIGGIDVCVGRLNLSLDILPELHLLGEPSRAIDWNGLSLSARYIFDKKERKTLRDRINLPKKSQNTKKKSRNM